MFFRRATQGLISRTVSSSSPSPSSLSLSSSLSLRKSLLSNAQRQFLPALSMSATNMTTRMLSASASPVPDMFCRQCEQTADHKACVSVGICGKSKETAAAQDALMAAIRSVSHWAVAAAAESDAHKELLAEVNLWTVQAAFSTLTNVNFSDQRIAEYIWQGEDLKEKLKKALSNPPNHPNADKIDLRNKSVEEIEEFGMSEGVPKRASAMGNEDAFALNELATYGLKGVCAYAAHCNQLLENGVPEDIYISIQKLWSKLDDSAPDVEGLMAAVKTVGEVNAQVMALLDQAHADFLGAPQPVEIRTTPVEGKCILVSGHDMRDLYELLKQTEGTGVNVYTHGEMLPAHTYPKLHEFPHLVGNYGTAWQNQKFEFATFPGPVIVTTNCIIEPTRAYRKRLYTMNEVGLDGVQHIGEDRDFSAVIEQAKNDCKGFPKTHEPATFHPAGFNHRVVMSVADKVIQAATDGNLSRIFVIGGCDGTQGERSYFTDLAEATPEDSLILTMGCAKNRLIHSKKLQGQTLGDTGLPRILDMGQCNDSYSAVVVALELAKAMKVNSVNDLPLSLAVSHLEQKAAAVLCTLLSLGIKNIRLGPSLPAYLTPNVLDILQQQYNLQRTVDAKGDLAQMMQGK